MMPPSGSPKICNKQFRDCPTCERGKTEHVDSGNRLVSVALVPTSPFIKAIMGDNWTERMSIQIKDFSNSKVEAVSAATEGKA